MGRWRLWVCFALAASIVLFATLTISAVPKGNPSIATSHDVPWLPVVALCASVWALAAGGWTGNNPNRKRFKLVVCCALPVVLLIQLMIAPYFGWTVIGCFEVNGMILVVADIIWALGPDRRSPT